MPDLVISEQVEYNPDFAVAYDELHASLHLVDEYRHDPEAIGRVCVSETSNLYLALLGEEAVGMAVLVKPFDSIGHATAVIEDVAVRQQYRGLRIGSALLDHLVQQASYFGASRIELHSKDVRKDAHILYVSQGFEIIETRLFRKVIQDYQS